MVMASEAVSLCPFRISSATATTLVCLLMSTNSFHWVQCVGTKEHELGTGVWRLQRKRPCPSRFQAFKAHVLHWLSLRVKFNDNRVANGKNKTLWMQMQRKKFWTFIYLYSFYLFFVLIFLWQFTSSLNKYWFLTYLCFSKIVTFERLF